MSATIIRLPNAQRSKIRCIETGVAFPNLYRLSGYNFKLKEGKELAGGLIQSRDDLEPNMRAPLSPAYTLGFGQTYAEIALPRWEPITHMDSPADDGVVYIRHHKNAESLSAYVDGICDTETHVMDDRWKTFCTDFGYFTILHRKANEDALNCALVYVTKVADPSNGGTMDWYHVVGPDGATCDIDDLVPRSIIEDFAPVKELLNS